MAQLQGLMPLATGPRRKALPFCEDCQRGSGVRIPLTLPTPNTHLLGRVGEFEEPGIRAGALEHRELPQPPAEGQVVPNQGF